jgi:hypothetical protein
MCSKKTHKHELMTCPATIICQIILQINIRDLKRLRKILQLRIIIKESHKA